MKLPIPRIFTALACAFALCVKAQDSTKTDKQNVFNASANYVSRLSYYGRVDSLQSSGLLPLLGIESKTGLYANTCFIFTQNTMQGVRYAGTSIEGGYKLPESTHFSGSISYTQFFYTNMAEIVQSAVKSQAALSLTWKNKYIDVTAGGQLKFSDGNTDIDVLGTLDHLFIIKIPSTTNMVLAVSPTATVNAGTQKFIQNWADKTGGLLGILPGGERSFSQNVNRFDVLSYEFSMPVVLVINKFYVALTPAYVIPENLITIPNRPDLSEYGKYLLYVTATAGMRLQFR